MKVEWVAWSKLKEGSRQMLSAQGINHEKWNVMTAEEQNTVFRRIEEAIFALEKAARAESASKAEEPVPSGPVASRRRQRSGPDVGGAFSRFSGGVDAILENSGLVGWQRAALGVLLVAAAIVVAAVVITLTSGEGKTQPPVAQPPSAVTVAPTRVGRATSTPASAEETVVPEATATKAAKKATSTPAPTSTPKPITDNSVTAAEVLGSKEWLLIVGSLILALVAAGEALGRIMATKKKVADEKMEQAGKPKTIVVQDLLAYLDILAPIAGFATVVFVSETSGSVGWWIIVAGGLAVAVFSGGFDLSPLWAFLSTAGAGYFLKGMAGLYANLPWFSGMVSGKDGKGNLGILETIEVINTKVIPLSAVFHLAMLVAVVGLAVEVLRKAKNGAVVLVGLAWPVAFWGFRALELVQNDTIKAFSLPLPAFLIAGLVHLGLSIFVGSRAEGESGRSEYGVAVRMDFILLGCVLALWSYVAFVP